MSYNKYLDKDLVVICSDISANMMLYGVDLSWYVSQVKGSLKVFTHRECRSVLDVNTHRLCNASQVKRPLNARMHS